MSASIAGTSGQDVLIKPGKRSWKIPALVVVTVTILGYLTVMLVRAATADEVLSGRSARFSIVQRGELVREIVVQGHIVAANSPTLFAPEAGHIELLVKAGDGVIAGQTLARVDSPQLQELLAQEEAHLGRLESDFERQKLENRRVKFELQQKEDLAGVNLRALRREKRRADRAYESKLISQLDFEEAADDVARAELEFAQSQHNTALESEMLDFDLQARAQQMDQQRLVVEALKRRIHRLAIVSPVDGMVGSLSVQPQQALTINQTLMTVIDLAALELEAKVPENAANELIVGMPARIKVNGDPFDAEIKAISPEVVNGEVVARIAFSETAPAGLRQNQRLSARILLQSKTDTLLVEKGPFFDTFRGHAFKVSGERAEKIPVTLGDISLRHVEVLTGLNEGDTVIISAVDVAPATQQLLISD